MSCCQLTVEHGLDFLIHGRFEVWSINPRVNGRLQLVIIVGLLLPAFLFTPIAMADEELVDPKKYLEETCKPKCVKPLRAYQACVKRVEGDESGHKHCTGQYFDYWSCVDKCVAPRLFSKLK
ncbi:hypothetical protein Nepgr_017486 [Nepenthes gracilis]|uniref:Complex III subunit VI n=1 Tax=Nepenthes gracilis TaxID=150966 RepID=A0AAD3XTE4_NEPGR|nr:hypothetical protein Nepgr_017486 [Nepenthes gracilis]